jgi:hypothetical protein
MRAVTASDEYFHFSIEENAMLHGFCHGTIRVSIRSSSLPTQQQHFCFIRRVHMLICARSSVEI